MPAERAGRGLPRVVEAAAAAAGLAAAWPVVLAAAVAVKATSPGPALFRQQRVGLHGRPFTMVKMRTMTVQNAGPKVTAGGDRRITRVGAVLRKWKLDELPTLWNVVKGDMSLVGPRPEVPDYVDLQDPLWSVVLDARPGLTDPVTLRLRNEEELLAAVQEDREAFYKRELQRWKLLGYADYVRGRSARKDLGVLLRTAAAVVVPALAPPPTVDEIRERVARGQ
jgi:lipopolysaccharide/colanic/teichoic acid biosynthesis glycosyltransferase